jgi:hypothetical protein
LFARFNSASGIPAKAKAELDHLNGAIALFEASGDLYRLCCKGEAIAIYKEALRQGPLTSVQMVVCIMDAKGLDRCDVIMAKTIAAQLSNSLVHQERRGGLAVSGEYRTGRLWRLPSRCQSKPVWDA